MPPEKPSNNDDDDDGDDTIGVEADEPAGSYSARLMDDETIQSLRRDLRQYEANVAKHGHMKEYVASKPNKVSRIELHQSRARGNNDTDEGAAIDQPAATSTVDGAPVARPPRPHRSSVIRRRDSFTTAVVKHHLGFDPLMQTDDDDKAESERISVDHSMAPRRPASAIHSHGQATTVPTKPVTRPRPATVNVGKAAARQRSFAQVHKEEKLALQGLEAQYSAVKDMLLRHMDRWGVRCRPDGDVSYSVFAKLSKFDEKLGIQHPEDVDNRRSPRPLRPPPHLTSHTALPHMSAAHHRQRPPNK